MPPDRVRFIRGFSCLSPRGGLSPLKRTPPAVPLPRATTVHVAVTLSMLTTTPSIPRMTNRLSRDITSDSSDMEKNVRAAPHDNRNVGAPVSVIEDDPAKTAEARAFVVRVMKRREWLERVVSGRPLRRWPQLARPVTPAKVRVRAPRPRAAPRTRRARSLGSRRAAARCPDPDPDPELAAGGARRRERLRGLERTQAVTAGTGDPR